MSVATVLRVSFKADDFDFRHLVQFTALDAAGDDGAAAFNVEHVLDAHQERLVDFARRQRNEGVHRVQQFVDGFEPLGLACQGGRGAAADDRRLVAGKLILVEQIADFHFHEVEQFRIIHQVNLVQENDDGRHADLAGQQNVLARLGHRAVRRADHQDGAVHLRRAGDHVLHVIGVAGAIDVRVMARRAIRIRRARRRW